MSVVNGDLGWSLTAEKARTLTYEGMPSFVHKDAQIDITCVNEKPKSEELGILKARSTFPKKGDDISTLLLTT